MHQLLLFFHLVCSLFCVRQWMWLRLISAFFQLTTSLSSKFVLFDNKFLLPQFICQMWCGNKSFIGSKLLLSFWEKLNDFKFTRKFFNLVDTLICTHFLERFHNPIICTYVIWCCVQSVYWMILKNFHKVMPQP